MIRHCVEASNIDENLNVIDATLVRHVTIAAGRIEMMSGLIDPMSHLNLDYPDHRVTVCVVAEKFEKGAKVQIDGDGLVFATVERTAYAHRGYVDYTQRLVDMVKIVKEKQALKSEAGHGAKQ